MNAHVHTAHLDLTISVEGEQVRTCLQDVASGRTLVDDAYTYRLGIVHPEGVLVCDRLHDIRCEMRGEEAIVLEATLGGLQLRHALAFPADGAMLVERLSLTNPGQAPVSIASLSMGFQRQIADGGAKILPELADHRLVGLPFLHKASDPDDWDNAFRLADLLVTPGAEQRATSELGYGYFPSLQRASEGWAWEQGDRCLLVLKFNQQGMEFSALGLETYPDRVCLRFGGASLVSGDPEYLQRIEPGQTVDAGPTYYQVLSGGYHQAAYAMRRILDAQCCRFPDDYDPPVHWNELYDNPEWNIGTSGEPTTSRHKRRVSYTRALMEEEAAKAAAYGAEALYLDPGWDTEFGTFFWGEEWLGNRREFVALMRDRYGLQVSLHCPLATWMSWDGRGVSSWPREAQRMDASGRLIEGSICLGARQYLDAAAERLLAHCADGVTFLMFDGTWWNGGCWNPNHGHPVPYTREAHCQACLSLAQRVHAEHPDVLIEMHDMITGGTRQRYTPVYYKYGLPGSYDDNWGFELMWQPMEDLLSGRARSLYYYNLACNVPLYLHIDLREDNAHCLCLWWYASTCRHLGIGGTHRDPLVAEAQRRAMQLYRQLKPFYVRGEFYGAPETPEEVHLHVLRDRNAVVINLFNLHAEERVLEGSVAVAELGLDPDAWYINEGPRAYMRHGRLHWRRRLPAYGADVIPIWPVSSLESKNT